MVPGVDALPAVVPEVQAVQVQYRKLKAIWKFISKGFSIGLWFCVTEILYQIYRGAIDNENNTYYISYIFLLYYRLSGSILLFPYLILSYPEPKHHAQRIIFDCARVFCSWSWVPSSVSSFVLIRLPD